MNYKLFKNSFGEPCFLRIDEFGVVRGSFFEDPANTDYQAYLKWLEEGNTPLPADEPTA